MEGVFWGILSGFLMGSLGYVLNRFIFSPVFQYRKIKRRLAKDLAWAEFVSEKDGLSLSETARIENFRRHAKALTHYTETVMPIWMQLSLERQNENPLLAASELMTLANIRTPGHLPKRIFAVRQHLRIRKKSEKTA